ncbi:GNAT family N-acetyltransferase [Halalkalibacter oceani]|uniref:GNAT family N-acetyltransferase n=1 Tax=Halalkalibacter oceani TaxID=1653776 RepID=UPI00339404D6
MDFIETNKVKVTSGKWYVENPPESFFFFDIDPKEFSSYAQELALINAMKLGIHLDFVDDKDKEIAYISLSNNSESTIDELIIKKADPKSDLPEISNFFEKHWGGTTMVSRGNAFNVLDEEIILAKRNKRIVGILAYSIQGSNIEILTLEAIEKYQNIGSLLLEKLEEIAVNKNIKSINLITSNDNLNAIRFYQRRGFSFKSVHIGAINKARKIKPSIPLIGDYGIKISDEIEFEKRVIKD